jgi:G:T-mismatch repair DNA endonuclease (very short patch repair protein)
MDARARVAKSAKPEKSVRSLLTQQGTTVEASGGDKGTECS